MIFNFTLRFVQIHYITGYTIWINIWNLQLRLLKKPVGAVCNRGPHPLLGRDTEFCVKVITESTIYGIYNQGY